MHARIEQLLSLRDGEPIDAAARQHVESCPKCSTLLAGLRDAGERLRSMPAVAPEAGVWAALQSRIAARHARTGRVAAFTRGAAAACLLALVLLIAVIRFDSPAPPVVSVDGGERMAGTATDEVARLKGQSIELDQLLAQMPERPAVERAETSMPIDAMETRVQWLDHQLSAADADGTPDAESAPLWRQRVELMSSLVRLRYVEAQRIAL